ncbi:MAG: hypothetical protein HOO95_08475 [Gallionella sp.]|nr:hypothetical protein [Gallionella sp.]
MLALPNTPNWIIAYYGILNMGGVAVLTNVHNDTETLLHHIASIDKALVNIPIAT